MAETLKDKILAMYGNLGQPSQKEIDPNIKDKFLDRALVALNEHLHDYRLRSISVVSGTQSYSPHESTVSVSKVYPKQASSKVITNTSTSIGLGEVSFTQYLSGEGMSVWDDIENYRAASHLLGEWKRLVDFFEWKWINNQIVLIPEPTSAYTLLYLSKEDFTWANIPNEMHEYMYNWYAHEHLKFLAAQRIGLQGVSAEGHSIQYPGTQLMSLSKDYKKDMEFELSRLKKLQQARV